MAESIRCEDAVSAALPNLDLSPGLHGALRGLAEATYPDEACGLLVGRRARGALVVARVTQGANLATERRRDRYRLDPRHWLAVETVARDRGLEVLGVWHTHPDHPARPSTTDLEAAWPGLTYLILSVCGGRVAEQTAWRLDTTGFVRQPLRTNVLEDVR